MAGSGWLTRSLADVPAGDGWLSARERTTLAGLRAPARRASWRLGRWAAKAAVSTWSGVPLDEVEIVSLEDGAPEALVDGGRAATAISLSHRKERALAVVADRPAAVGCDLELIEPRSPAFVSTWLAPAERAQLAAVGEQGRAALANLIWTAKEAAAKARHEGLRLDVGHAVVELEWEPADDGAWRELRVRWERDGLTAHGWWRQEPVWVFALVSEPPTPSPRSL